LHAAVDWQQIGPHAAVDLADAAFLLGRCPAARRAWFWETNNEARLGDRAWINLCSSTRTSLMLDQAGKIKAMTSMLAELKRQRGGSLGPHPPG
jgi:hypothetical protein